MTKLGKTFKDLKDFKSLRYEKEPRPEEKGGHRNLIREALEELAPEEKEEKEEKDEFPEV